MRHRKRSVNFGRHQAHKKATVAAILRGLILHSSVETTLAKAKETRMLADRLITWGKKGRLHGRRLAYSVLTDRVIVGRLFKEIAPLFADRQGGYTRIIHTRKRVGDNAQLAILEWTVKPEVKVSVEKKAVKKEDHKQVEKKEAPVKHETKPETKPQTPEKLQPKEAVKEESKEKNKDKGFLGGLKNLFDKKKKD